MARPGAFEVRSELDDGIGRLTVAGELDLATTPQLDEQARQIVARGARELTVDLSKLRFIDSSGLSMLIVLRDRAETEGWTLRMVRPSAPPLTILTLTGADENLPFVDDPDLP